MSLKIKQNPIVDGIAVQPRVGPDLAQQWDETNRLDRGFLALDGEVTVQINFDDPRDVQMVILQEE